MKRDTTTMLGVLVLPAAIFGTQVAVAKLPAPTPEQQAQMEQKKAQEQAQLEKEKAALTRVQDEVAARYRRTSGTDRGQPSGTTQKDDLPKAVREAPRDAGPHGGTEPSAEAHSAPAK
jgi:hypothetical protein